jgi:hypothetical protein
MISAPSLAASSVYFLIFLYEPERGAERMAEISKGYQKPDFYLMR